MIRPRTTSLVGSSALLAALTTASLGFAQDRSDPLLDLSPGRSISVNEDTTAVTTNPGALAFLPTSEFRWTATYLSEEAKASRQGHSLAVGFPIPWVNLATAARVDLMNQPDAIDPNSNSNYGWLTWGLALRGGDSFGLGFALQRSYSEASGYDNLTTWDVGATWRMSDGLAVGAVADNVSGPQDANHGNLERNYTLGVHLRPFGTSAFDLAAEGRYQDIPQGYWSPRGVASIEVPYVGLIRGDLTYEDPNNEAGRKSWLATGSVVLNLNGPGGVAEVSGGLVNGTQLGGAAREEWASNIHTELAFRGMPASTGVDLARYAVRVTVEATPGSRGHVALLRQLWGYAEEDSIDAVILELRASPAGSLAQADELRDAMLQLRRQGKRVLCHFENGGVTELYTCAAASQVLMAPAGVLRVAGLSMSYFHVKGLLDKLGVRADFVRAGAHKSAPEMFDRTQGSPTAQRDWRELLQNYELQLSRSVAGGRKLAVSSFRERLATGPFTAPEAKTAGFIDGYAFSDQLEEKVEALTGRDELVIDSEDWKQAEPRFGLGRRIAMLYAHGDIVDGRSQTFPFTGSSVVGSYSMQESLKQLREDPSIAAIVFRIESPGGSAIASDTIWREIELTQRVKPVVVSMGNVAASGGYYIAAPATRIFANPLTLTGSIGVFYGKADVSELFKNIGLNVETYRTAPRADADSFFRPFSDDERVMLQKKVDQMYQVFLDRVSTGRKMKTPAVDRVAQGQVWLGEQARAHGLVDEVGGLRQALAFARLAAELPSYAPIYEVPDPGWSLLVELTGGGAAQDKVAAAIPPQLRQTAASLEPFLMYDGSTPVARMELVIEQP